MAIETTGNGEFNARDARRIASRSENPYISRFEKEIKQAAEDGDRGVLLCYTDCCSNAHAALAVLEGRGFTIVRRSENIGGVMQHPAYYAEREKGTRNDRSRTPRYD